MDDVSQPEQTIETDDVAPRTEVEILAHKSSSYPFDPSKEPLLRDNPRRFVIFPIEYQDIWEMYKKVNLVQTLFRLCLLRHRNPTWNTMPDIQHILYTSREFPE